MFAILKFQQRKNAAAFSHAFVLTIQIPSSENSLRNLRCPIDEVDSNVPVDNDEAAKSVIRNTNETSAKETETRETIGQISRHDGIGDTLAEVLEAIKTSDPRDNAKDSTNVHENPDGDAKCTATTYLADESTEFLSNTTDNESANCDVRKHKRTAKQSVEDAQEQCPSKRRRTEESKKPDATNQESESVRNVQKEKSCSTDTVRDDERSLSNGLQLADNLTKEGNIAKNNKDTDKDVPYQYFVEKEIDESARRKKKSSAFSATDQREDSPVESKNNNEKSTAGSDKMLDVKSVEESNKRHALMNANNQSQSTTHHKSHKARNNKQRTTSRESTEKKAVPDNKVLRSSNITDLVMEGLMFTIRQDRDSVAVIEQKTKLEVDEVLENSEKAETKAGEKCLLNSSLLRLENMVTMFDSPRDKHERARNKTATGNNAYSAIPFANSSSIYSNTNAYNLDGYYVDRGMNKSGVQTHGKHGAAASAVNSCRFGWDQQRAFSCTENSDAYSLCGDTTRERDDSMEWRTSDNEQSVTNNKTNSKVDKEEKRLVGEEEEDISKSFQSTVFSTEETTSKESQKKSSLVDPNVQLTYNKCDGSAEGDGSSLSGSVSNSTETYAEEKTPGISTQSSESRQKANNNTPRIISDNIITIDLMPAALRNAVRNTCKAHRFSSSASNGETLQQREREMGRDSGEEASLKNKYVESCANDSSDQLVDFDSDEVSRDKDESPVTVNDEDGGKHGNTSTKNSRERKNGTHCDSQRTASKRDSPRKLQDITKEFYYDLHVQSKDNAAQQRSLRQRRRGASNIDDAKSDRVRIEMLKFIQDITEGARVVVRRLNIE